MARAPKPAVGDGKVSKSSRDGGVAAFATALGSFAALYFAPDNDAMGVLITTIVSGAATFLLMFGWYALRHYAPWVESE